MAQEPRASRFEMERYRMSLFEVISLKTQTLDNGKNTQNKDVPNANNYGDIS